MDAIEKLGFGLIVICFILCFGMMAFPPTGFLAVILILAAAASGLIGAFLCLH